MHLSEGCLGRSAADRVVNGLFNAGSVLLPHQPRVERNERVLVAGQDYGFKSRCPHFEEALVVSESGAVELVVVQGVTPEPFFFKLLLDHGLGDVHAGIGVPPHEPAEGEQPNRVDDDGPRIQHAIRRDGAACELRARRGGQFSRSGCLHERREGFPKEAGGGGRQASKMLFVDLVIEEGEMKTGRYENESHGRTLVS